MTLTFDLCFVLLTMTFVLSLSTCAELLAGGGGGSKFGVSISFSLGDIPRFMVEVGRFAPSPATIAKS